MLAQANDKMQKNLIEGKSWFSEIAASSMFGPVWKQLRGTSFTANGVLGLREQLGAIRCSSTM